MIKFNQRNLNKNILPRRQKSGILDWTDKEEQTLFLNTVDIVELQKNNCEFEIIEDEDNFYFSHVINGSELFKCVLYFKQIKEEQDKYKNNKDSRYNPVLRQMAKLFLNSLSGKVIQNIIMETTTIENIWNIEKILKNVENKKYKSVDINNRIGDKVAVTVEINEDEALKNGNMPIYLGVLIYAYARRHMYNNIIKDYDVIYQDTDSGFLIKSESDNFIKNNSNMIGDNFGQFE
jgi:hypothetical protein